MRLRLPVFPLAVLAFVLASPWSVAQPVPEWASPDASAPTESPHAVPDRAAPSPYTPSATSAPQMITPPDPPDGPARVPVDGGLGLLALAGGAYAARRLRASR